MDYLSLQNVTQFCSGLKNCTVGRTIKVFRFEAHPRRKVINVIGEVTITVVANDTKEIKKQRTEEFKKTIHLIALNEASDPGAVAQDVLSSCPFIDETLKSYIEEVVWELKCKEYDPNGVALQSQTAADGSFLPRYPEVLEAEEEFLDLDEHPHVDISQLNHYVELLYNNVTDKIEGTRCISWLTKTSNYMAVIAEHESALNAIFRTLKEDSKKSIELTSNILAICLDYAKIKEFHSVLEHHKISKTTLEIIDFEQGRFEQWKMQVNIKKNELAGRDPDSSSIQAQNEFQKLKSKLEILSTAQGQLLKLAYDILTFLSENVGTMDVLIDLDFLPSIEESLQRGSNPLTESALGLLKNATFNVKVVERMENTDIFKILAKILRNKSPVPKRIVCLCLKILFNVSFKMFYCQRMVELMPVFASCFEKPGFKEVSCKLLYMLSTRRELREKLSKSSIINELMDQLYVATKSEMKLELAALAVNLSKSSTCSKMMAKHSRFSEIVDIGLRMQSTFIVKILKNLAENGENQCIYELTSSMPGILRKSTNNDFISQCVEFVSLLDLKKIKVSDWMEKSKLVDWIKSCLLEFLAHSSIEKKDAFMKSIKLRVQATESIVLLGTWAESDEGAMLFITESLFDILMRVLMHPLTDDQMKEQILYAFYMALKKDMVGRYVSNKTTIGKQLLSFAEGTQAAISYLTLKCLDKLSEYDDFWKTEMMQYKFLIHNKDWVLSLPSTVCESQKHEKMRTPRFSFVKSIELSDSSEYEDEKDYGSGAYGGRFHDPPSLFALFQRQYDEEMRSRSYDIQNSKPPNSTSNEKF